MVSLFYFFYIIAHIPGIIIRYVPFSNDISKDNKKKLILIYAILLIINYLICLKFQLVLGVNLFFYKINFLIFSIILSIVNNIVIRNKTYEHLFIYGFSEIIVLILVSVSTYIEGFFNIQDIYLSMTLSNILFIIIFFILYIPIKKIIINTFSPFWNNYKKYYWKKIWIVSISLFFSSLISTPFDKYTVSLEEILDKLSIGITTIIICKGITFHFMESMKIEKILEQVNLQNNYYKALSESVEKVRKARHDLKHHISAISCLVERQEFNQLNEYLEKYKESYKLDCYVPYSGNSAADGILYHYMECANKNGITFNINCSFNNLHINDVDLCILLGNVLENAITASKNLNSNKFISVYSENNGTYFTLIVDNSFDGIVKRENGKIISKKENNEGGIGIISMESICKKYNGYCSFEEMENTFHSSFILENNICK